jgi:hypothetical protein
MVDADRAADERAFDRLREVLAGARAPLDPRASKVLRLILGGDHDLEITRARFAVHLESTRSRYPQEYFRRLSPPVVSFFLERVGVASVPRPLVFGLPAGKVGPPDDAAEWSYPGKRVWIVPGDAVKVVVRTSPEPHEAPFVSGIPTEGPLALRELPLYAPTYRDSRTPIVCPRCGAAATRHRALTSALVCPHCARSFEV